MNIWLWLTLPVAVLLTIAAGGGEFSSGLYRDTPYFVAQAVGQDIISLFVVLPTLIISAFFTSRGAPTGRLIWLGVLVYLVYTYAVAAFNVRFNPLFLVYVALLGCSLYALIGGLVTTDMVNIKGGFTGKTRVTAASIYLAVLAFLFYFKWLSEIIPSLAAGNIPQSVQQIGVILVLILGMLVWTMSNLSSPCYSD
jgi:hypothetical protein